jgi:hypothetical protein
MNTATRKRILYSALIALPLLLPSATHGATKRQASG